MAIKTSSRVEENTSRSPNEIEPKVSIYADPNSGRSLRAEQEKSEATRINSEKARSFLGSRLPV